VQGTGDDATLYGLIMTQKPMPVRAHEDVKIVAYSSSRDLWKELVEDHAMAVSVDDATHNRAKIKHHVYGRN
jgi:hypothetical protein